MKGFIFVIFLVYFMNEVNLGSAMKCYTCTSTQDTKCTNKIDSSVLSLDCTDGEPVCLTLVAAGVTLRKCAEENFCAEYDKADGVSCKTCKTELCNSESGAFVPNYSTSLGIFFALFITLKLFI